MSKILIVDDNAQNMYLVHFLLEKQSHDIDEAVNGQEAVELASNNIYDLILMDIQMPVMDGLEATKIIKREDGAPAIVALTAMAMSGDEKKIMSSGCDGYIHKPINPSIFVAQVEEYL